MAVQFKIVNWEAKRKSKQEFKSVYCASVIWLSLRSLCTISPVAWNVSVNSKPTYLQHFAFVGHLLFFVSPPPRPLLFLSTSRFFQLFPLTEPLNRLAMTIKNHSGSDAPFATTSILRVEPLKSPLPPILGLVIPVYYRQTSFSNASVNFYEKPMAETEPTGCKENMGWEVFYFQEFRSDHNLMYTLASLPSNRFFTLYLFKCEKFWSRFGVVGCVVFTI